jgi:MSHA pilin protein MshD
MRAGISRGACRGFTLIELIVAVTIVAICAVTLMGVMAAVASRSADAMLQQQAIAIAQAYLDEIEQRWVAVDPTIYGTVPDTGRSSWDLVSQYNNLNDVGAHDQFGVPIAALSAYMVSVNVSQSTALPGITGANALRIDVTVTTPPNVSVTLSGYRTNY